MNKKLKLFGLLALTVALGAGVAWAFDTLTLSGNHDDDLTLASGGTSTGIITGNGTQRGGVTLAVVTNKVLRLDAASGNTVTLAPGDAATVGSARRFAPTAPGTAANIQVVVNSTNDHRGKVVMKASDGDHPTGATMTSYTGGTVQVSGTLGVTNGNALGQAWVGVLGNYVAANAPVFQSEGVNEVQLGILDPSNALTNQPFYLLANTVVPTAPRLATDLRYVTINAEQTSSSNRGVMLHHGLDQRDYTTATYAAGAGADTHAAVNAQTPNRFVRLTKTGTGRLWVNGGNDTLAPDATTAVVYAHPVDGLHHFGGTVVDGGTLEVLGGRSATEADHFRGSLGRTWNAFTVAAVAPNPVIAPMIPYLPGQYLANARAGGVFYNPLFINNNGRVIVDRSQFFSDFNVAANASFYAHNYTLKGATYNPQIVVTLDDNDSKADGLLEGEFDLVLFSGIVPVANRPTAGHDTSDAITQASQAIFFINNPDNKIFASGDTLVGNGVLEIAGAKSIGGGQVTIGAVGGNALPNRGFTTPAANGLGTFAAAKTFKLENVTLGQARGAVAVEQGETLSFKDITLNNMGTAATNSFRINPVGVALGEGYNATVVPDDPFTGVTPLALPLPGSWTNSATVAFGSEGSGDAKYAVEGVLRNPTRVDVERGVWQLNSFPTPTAAQAATGVNPFMNVYVYPTAVLSLAKDVNDFSPYMDLKVTDDSRIRVVLRDSDIAATRADAMGKAPVFQAHHIDYTALGTGAQNKDRRLNIQLDPSQLTGGTIKQGWVKLVFSTDAKNWNHLHYLREYTPGLTYEDYAKIRITWTTTSDIVKNAVAHVDQNSYTILVEVGENVTDPVNPSKPTPPAEDKLTTTLTPSVTSVAPGAEVTVTLGDWTYKGASADVVSEDVTVTGGTIKTPLAGKKVVLTAGAEGTMTVTATSVLKSDATVKGSATTSITVTKGGGSGKKSDSGGGCDAGFGALALVAGAAFLLRRKN